MLGRLAILSLAGLLAFAQENAPPPERPAQYAGEEGASPIRVQVNEVIVPVTVTDSEGRFVSNLEKPDFKVFDQGVEQEIEFFTAERNQPVVIGFLVEQSNAMRLYWKRFRESTLELILALMPEDPKFSGYLISYSNDAELVVDTTWEPTAMLEAIREMKPGGGSALYDAIYMSCTNRELVEGEPIEPRRVLVIIGDGHDNASEKTLEEVLELAQRNLVTIYAMSTVSFEFDSEHESNLLRLARETGGRVEYPLDDVYDDISGYLSKPSDAGNYAITVGTGGYSAHLAEGMFDSIAALSGEITTQYILRYTPKVTDDPRIFRNIRVEVALPSVKIRHRAGYYPYAP
jgi:Ca-activated chloride channel family protein